MSIIRLLLIFCLPMNIRTRIAPSPTGAAHIGTAYIALFNFCFARHNGGQFLLRIEDTDRARSSIASEREILEALRWLGLEWDEGPDAGGDCGLYRQSERGALYREHAERLVAEGHAFRCFATSEELAEMRREQIARGETARYDGRGLQLSAAEVQRRLDAGEPHVIRLKVPQEGACVVEDLLRGPISIEWSQVDMQVLLKADGLPTYHLANVVDDHLMAISHVIRGEEWLNSVPKHLLLYRAYDWQPPVFCHLPLLRNPDRSKLSKRRNPTGILYYQRTGYLPEALLNYLGLIGWSMPDGREQFSIEEMIRDFDIGRVSLGGPMFDPVKLRKLNSEWIRGLGAEELEHRLGAWLLNREFLQKILPHVHERMETFADLQRLTGFLFVGSLPLSSTDFAHCKLPAQQQMEVLQFCVWELEEMRAAWCHDEIFTRLQRIAGGLEIPLRDFLAPVFIAVTGSGASFSVAAALEMLGPDLGVARLRDGLAALGGLSGKSLKKLEKKRVALNLPMGDEGVLPVQ